MAYKKVYRKNFGNNNSEEGARTGGAGYGNSGGNTAMVTSGNEIIFDLGKKKQVTVRTFRNINLVDIREYYVDKTTGENRPGKKGISLTEDTWNTLLENQKNINKALDKLAGRSAPLKKNMDSVAVEDIKKNGSKKRKNEVEPKLPPKRDDEEEEAELVMPVAEIKEPQPEPEPVAKKQKTASKKSSGKKANDSDSDSDFDDDLDNLVKELESEED